MIAALFVEPGGPYFGQECIQPWDQMKDARSYSGPYPVIAHPPCERWGRYWSGGPSASYKRKLGDDNGCFKAALKAVRNYGGVIEHPEASHAFKKFGLPIPKRTGGWTDPDKFGGRSCCVAQGHYGHVAQKLTWIYLKGNYYPALKWGLCPNMLRLDRGAHSTKEHRELARQGVCKRLSKDQRIFTPIQFRDLLVCLVLGGGSV